MTFARFSHRYIYGIIYDFRTARRATPTQRTTEVAARSNNQSESKSGETENSEPPKLTMSTCPSRMKLAMRKKPRQPRRRGHTWDVAKLRALNKFQNWSRTKKVKKMLNS